MYRAVRPIHMKAVTTGQALLEKRKPIDATEYVVVYADGQGDWVVVDELIGLCSKEHPLVDAALKYPDPITEEQMAYIVSIEEKIVEFAENPGETIIDVESVRVGAIRYMLDRGWLVREDD